MIINYLLMDGYGIYVWSSFIFTFICFAMLYLVIRLQLKKEQKRFQNKYFDLTRDEAETIKNQKTYREILTFTRISKI